MEHKDKKLNQLVDRLMDNDALESPSIDFTSRVMQKLNAETENKAFVYRPLISKPVWFLLTTAFIILVAYIYFNEPSSNSGWFNTLNLRPFKETTFGSLNLKFTKTGMYAMLLLAIMIGIQIPLLKNYYNKRLEF